MGHGITDADSMVSTGKIPWHELGARTDHLMTVDEALKLGGLDWEVLKQPLYVHHDDGVVNQLLDWVATVRSTDGLPLGAVKPNYTPISNRELAEFQAAVLDVMGNVQAIETAGSLFGGRVVWFLFQVPKHVALKDGSTIAPYAMIAASHNATLPVIQKCTPIRVECANTLDMSIAGAGNTYRFKHTREWKSRLIQAQEALDLTFQYLDAFEESANALISRKMTYKELLQFTEVLFPSATDKVATRTQNRRDEVLALVSGSDNLQNVKATAWGAYNAVAEYVDHHGTYRETEGGTRPDNRAYSILNGQASTTKARALAILQEMGK